MKKLVSIEYLRALSMLYIVGFWHLFNYTDAFPGYKNIVTSNLTLVVLALFVLVSGFLIGITTVKQTEFREPAAYWNFYKKRLLRIYPLYALAVGIFYLYGINDAAISIGALTLVSMLWGEAPKTLWFITMIMLFYIATPFLINRIKKPLEFLVIVGAIVVALCIAKILIKSVDPRPILYFPCFCLGLYTARVGMTTRYVNGKMALMLLILGLPLLFAPVNAISLKLSLSIPFVLAASYLLLKICVDHENRFKENQWINFFAFSSFAMYLFHRPIYSSLIDLYFPEQGIFQILYLMVVGVSVVAIFSWLIQSVYDRLQRQITSNHTATVKSS